jgi:hypothetical protein
MLGFETIGCTTWKICRNAASELWRARAAAVQAPIPLSLRLAV